MSANDPFYGEICLFPFNFPPKGWAFCHGQLMPLSQNTALFSLLGTTYGGDGKSTFALPDLQASIPVMAGQSVGLSERFLGEVGGTETITLLQSEIPIHTHTLAGSAVQGDSPVPNNAFVASTTADNLFRTELPNTTMAPQMLSITGGSLPHNNLMPYLVLNYCIALQGVFPERWPQPVP